MTKTINNETTVKIELPFMGFYESTHSEAVDYALESEVENYELEDDSLIFDDVNIDYMAIYKEYAKAYSDAVATEFNLKTLNFDEMQSPREYNFSTDRIFCTMSRNEFDKIRKEVYAYDEWPELVKERCTSYDGFISFYSNDSKDEQWSRETLDEPQTEIVLNAYFDHEYQTGKPGEWQYYLDIELYALDAFGDACNLLADACNVRKGATKN